MKDSTLSAVCFVLQNVETITALLFSMLAKSFYTKCDTMGHILHCCWMPVLQVSDSYHETEHNSHERIMFKGHMFLFPEHVLNNLIVVLTIIPLHHAERAQCKSITVFTRISAAPE